MYICNQTAALVLCQQCWWATRWTSTQPEQSSRNAPSLRIVYWGYVPVAGNLISEIMFEVINDTHQTANLGLIIVVRQEALVNKRCRWIKSTTRGYVLTSGIENSLGNHSPNDGDVGKGMLKQEASTNVVNSTLYDATQKWPLVK